MTANLSVRGNVIDDTGGPVAAGPSLGYLPGPLTGADGSRRQRGDPMSAQTYEWYIETTSSRRGDLVVGPWQDELAEPVTEEQKAQLGCVCKMSPLCARCFEITRHNADKQYGKKK